MKAQRPVGQLFVLFVLFVVGLGVTLTWAQPPDRQRQRGQRRGGMTWDNVMQRGDANEDGKLTRDEFPGPSQAFDRMDSNGDGTITKQEFENGMGNRRGGPPGSMRRGYGPTGGLDANAVFELLDVDKSGNISVIELQRFFGTTDTNKDKRIDRTELTKALSANPIERPSGAFSRFQSFPTARPAAGASAPNFELRGLDGKVVSLTKLLESKPVVLEFGSFT